MIITIDGPTASGKSTTARAIAQELGILYINSGLFYRVIAYVLIRQEKYTSQQLSHIQLEDIEHILSLDKLTYIFSSQDGEHIIYLDDDITPLLKNGSIDQGASIVSTRGVVREEVNKVIRRLAHTQSIIIDGRDCGTVIFPHADYKFYLTAVLKTRASRWQADQVAKGNIYTIEQAVEQITQRDGRDSSREVAPLAIPEHAVVIDDTNISKEQVVKTILDIVKK